MLHNNDEATKGDWMNETAQVQHSSSSRRVGATNNSSSYIMRHYEGFLVVGAEALNPLEIDHVDVCVATTNNNSIIYVFFYKTVLV